MLIVWLKVWFNLQTDKSPTYWEISEKMSKPSGCAKLATPLRYTCSSGGVVVFVVLSVMVEWCFVVVVVVVLVGGGGCCCSCCVDNTQSHCFSF